MTKTDDKRVLIHCAASELGSVAFLTDDLDCRAHALSKELLIDDC